MTRCSISVKGSESAALLTVGDPDVLDFGGPAQELPSLTLAWVEPVAAAGHRPGALHVAGRGRFHGLHAVLGPEIPQGVHIQVFGKRLGEPGARARHDVDHAAGN